MFLHKRRLVFDVTTLKMTCSPNLEALFINCKLFYSPREFSSFILMNVYVASGRVRESCDATAGRTNIWKEPTRDSNILDHCYTLTKDAYHSVPWAALGLSLSGGENANLRGASVDAEISWESVRKLVIHWQMEVGTESCVSLSERRSGMMGLNQSVSVIEMQNPNVQ